MRFFHKHLPLAPGVLQTGVALLVALLCVLPLFGLVRGSRRLGAQLAGLALPAGEPGSPERSGAARRGLTAGLQLAVLLSVALPALLVTEPFLPGFTSLGLLCVLVVMSFSMIWRGKDELQGQVRSGAQLFVATLGQLGRLEAPPVDEMGSLLPSLGPALHVLVPVGHTVVGSTLAELGLYGVADLTVLAIDRGQRKYVLPHGNEIVCAGDGLSIAGDPAALERALESLGLELPVPEPRA